MLWVVNRVKRRIEHACALRGVTYPWWIPASSTSACASFTAISVVGRGGLAAPAVVLLAAVLALVPLFFWTVAARLLPKNLEAAMMLAAVALMLTQKADGPDFAPLILMLAAAETAGMAGFWNSVVVTASSVGILVVADVEGTLIGAPVYLVGIVVGVWVGIALHWQQRAISAERARREAAQEQAVQAERQRIAREVHDVVGHSLSVTLLHLTGARLALEQDGDIEEAVHALTDAERIGRAAMTDLRRSVGLLAADKSAIEPLPNIDDLAVLVDDVRNAGIDIRLVQSGDLSRVGASSGLGLYRIAQESLANIVKHAPTSHGSVVLAAANGHVRLTIRNTVAEPPAAETDGGTGLPGMAARAEQLGATLKAGPDGNEWVVDVLVPLAVTV